jgi:hypothetical protein
MLVSTRMMPPWSMVMSCSSSLSTSRESDSIVNHNIISIFHPPTIEFQTSVHVCTRGSDLEGTPSSKFLPEIVQKMTQARTSNIMDLASPLLKQNGQHENLIDPSVDGQADRALSLG